MDNPGIFGEWLKLRRKNLDLTQEELAERAGCSVFALRKIESGERRPSKQLAELLAIALDVEPAEIPTFIRVARGDLNLERLGQARSDLPAVSISDFVHQTPGPPLPQQKPAPPAGAQIIAAVPLPLPPTPLLGREGELAAIERIFADPHCRLLTLTGMGGIGKTRLAVEFAAQYQALFPGGVYFVPLAPIESPDSFIPSIADVLGYSFSGPAELKEQLVNFMAVRLNQPTLLVLDNLEHLIVQSSLAANLVSELIRRIPCLKILTTSRERLNLHGEWMYELHGLPVPPELADSLDEYSAATLFLQRAQQITNDFAIGEREKADLVRICRLVEGIPLAIELAAAWVGLLSCKEIAQEIETNIDFLTTSMRDIPERHRSLRAVFNHSWKLLSDHERTVLARLSIFRGGFDRRAAETVAEASLVLLASLLSKSLIRRADNNRYDLHEVIRQYAAAHLEADDSKCAETCRRHSRYYLELASGFQERLKTSEQQTAMREMGIEIDNIRTAWNWGVSRRSFEMVGRAVRAYGWYFEISGLLPDGIDQLGMLVSALKTTARNLPEERVLGMSLLHLALLVFRSGHFSQAQSLYSESIEHLRPVADRKLLADALIFSGTLAHLSGDYPGSLVLLNEGIECAEAAQDGWFYAYGIFNLGYVASLTGNYQKGYEQMTGGLDLWRQIGDPLSITLGLNFRVPTQLKLERFSEAEASMRESIALSERTGYRWGMGTAYRYLGLTMLAENRWNEAKEHFRKSLEIFGETVQGWDIALSMIYLGNASLMAGELQDAERIHRDALRIAREAHAVPLMLETLAGMALRELRTGNAETARTLADLVIRHPASETETKVRAEKLVQEAGYPPASANSSEDEELSSVISNLLDG